MYVVSSKYQANEDKKDRTNLIYSVLKINPMRRIYFDQLTLILHGASSSILIFFFFPISFIIFYF